jgi:hypothetical protein
MAISVYFNNQNATREQFLVEDFVIESIKNHGIDVYYIPRASQSTIDVLFGDDTVKYFNDAVKIDVYLETFDDYEGDQEFFSKFGLEIKKSARVALARRTFEKFVSSATNIDFPREGDLIWLPIQQKLMEIRFVEQEKNFFQLGRNIAKAAYMYGLSIEAFKYSGEFLNTGMTEIDDISADNTYSIEYSMASGVGSYKKREIVYQGPSLQNSTATGIVVDYNKPNNKLILRNMKGAFVAGSPIVGTASSTSLNIVNFDAMENKADPFDNNVIIENEADNILDFTEDNPFGTP